MEFNLLGKKKEYPDGFDKISVELGNYIAKANDSFNNFIGLYQSNKNLNEVIYYMQGQASGIIGEMSQRAVLILTGSGVNISFEDFFSKYQNTMQFDYNMHIAMTLNAQAQVMNAFSQRQMMKGQPANPNQLDGEARSSLSALYKDERTKMMLSEAIRTCIINIYNTVLYALVENNIYPESILISKNKASELYSGSFQGYAPNAEQIVCAIYSFPAEKQYYDSIFRQLIAEDSEDFEHFLKFWGIDYFYPHIAEKRKAAKDFDAKIKMSELANFDYNVLSTENYVFLRNKLNEMGYSDTLGYPELSVYSGYIKNFYQNICLYENFFNNPLYISHLKKDASLQEFIEIIKQERDTLPINPYRSIWIYGDPMGDKVPLSPKQNILQAVAYEGDSIIINCPQGLMGNKGIMLTTRYIVDLGKNIRIPLSNVTDIVYLGADNIRITDGMQAIDLGKLSASYIGKLLPNPQMKEGLVRSLTFAFLNLIKIYCIRYGGNQFLAQSNPYLV
ncbi:MAG: hypothetical protein IJ763_10875 [Lachnospiraceae bacterium]|nr:hypothetical protein [Lachnospiraceae bacterium]MBR1817181.1 hypothetical protein [Lachnospiraceae bacterium]